MMSDAVLLEGPYGNGVQVGITILDRQWIETDEKLNYHGWPTVCNMGNDRLALVCSGEREAHEDPFGRVLIYESPDGGKTWSKPRKLSNGPLDDRDAGIIVTPAGTWLLNYFTSLSYVDKGDRQGAQAHWNRVEDSITVGDLQREHGFFLRRSADRGKTWSEKYRIGVNNVHGPIVLHDGSLFYCGRADSGCCIQPSTWAEEIVCMRSTDDGLTWQEISRFRTGDFGEHQLRTWCELHSVETASGKIITQIRINHSATWQMVSEDGGKSWHGLHPVADGLPPHLLKLHDGRLLMSYGLRRRPLSGSRCRVSSDEGETWSEPIIISEDSPSPDMGYASTAELADGTLVTAWYQFRPEKGVAQLQCARWRFNDRPSVRK